MSQLLVPSSKVSYSKLSEVRFDNQNLICYIDSLRKKYIHNNKVLLVQSPQFLFHSFNPEVARRRGYYAYPPTGLQWIAQVLAERGLEIKILDLNFLILEKVIEEEHFDYHNWLNLLDEHLEKIQPSVVGATSINVNSNIYEPGYPLTSILRHVMEKNQSLVLAGGAIATDEREDLLLKNYCHFVIGNEGENKIKLLFDYLYQEQKKQPFMQGIYFPWENKLEQSVGHSDTVTLQGNLIDTFDLIPTEDYHRVGCLNPYSRISGQDTPFSVLQLFRGCTAKCDFCDVNNFMGNGVRHFPVEEVVKEITYLVEERGIRHFDVLDDAFLANKHVVSELLKELVKLKQKYGITWSSNNGLIATQLTEELLELMRDSGCVGFRIGVESGNPQMLRRMRKPATLSKLYKAAALMNRFPEMFTGANYIIGLFGEETFGQMLESFRVSCELNLDWASWATFQFTSNRTPGPKDIKLEERKGGGDFVPSKGDTQRQVDEKQANVSGSTIFKLPEDQVPAAEDIKQIWFAFNLVSNFINNKNLKEGGRPEKFTSWVEALIITYPKNPYMFLFAGLGRMISEQKDLADQHVRMTKELLSNSDYWKNRFEQFNLGNFVDHFPDNKSQVLKRMAALREEYKPWTG